MKLPIFKQELVGKSNFLSFWSRQYSYKYEHLYNDNIGKELTEKRIWALFVWKNGGPLSEKKSTSVRRNFIKERTKMPLNSDKGFLFTYLSKPGGAIWRIFWLHCNYPQTYPMCDQHVHRTMAKIKEWKDIEIPIYNKDKVEIYINEYLPFWDEFSEFPSKRVDEALWAYGKFLKSGYDFFDLSSG
jgi:hypothetical protein